MERDVTSLKIIERFICGGVNAEDAKTLIMIGGEDMIQFLIVNGFIKEVYEQ